ncbi:MAG: phytoene/squalene synthase family protein [Gemmatimonadales bacterium]|jgi:phytoene synthase
MRSSDVRSPDRADVAVCLELLRIGSRSFHAASLLLPRRVRHAAAAVYAFCRVADDAVDGGDLTHATLSALHRRLDRIFAGEGLDDPVDRALTGVVIRHALPRRPFELLLEGFQWEWEARRYDTIDDVRAYAVRVAGSVGALMALLLGRRDLPTLSRAVDLGVAMQLTNIARDVGEDARRGRLYLPHSWLRDAGLDPDEWRAAPRAHPGIDEAVHRVLVEADRLYRRSEAGLPHLPWRARPAIRAARLIYADIGTVLLRRGCDPVTDRAVTSTGRKVRFLARALLPLAGERLDTQSVLAEGAALVAALASPPRAPWKGSTVRPGLTTIGVNTG